MESKTKAKVKDLQYFLKQAYKKGTKTYLYLKNIF